MRWNPSDEPPQSGPPASPGGGAPPADERAVIVGHYRIIRPLGAGGMARVFLAEDLKDGARRALKIRHQRAESESAIIRFKLEFRALSRLDHPGVVRVHEYGLFRGRPYLAMDYIQGQPITRWLQLQAVASPQARAVQALRLAIQVAEALEHVHARGLVHRDLKPDNLLVDARGKTRLLDFGVAQELGQMDTGELGSIIGTLAYASPEQVAGREVDHRTDLYSFGIILYEVLTGARPFTAEHVAAYIIKHITEIPVPPAERQPGIPLELSAVVMRLLEKQPQARYRSATELAAALRDVEATLTAGRPARRPTQAVAADTWVFEPAFAGRAAEAAHLKAAFDALAGGEGGVRFILGPSGIGKGRLLSEALGDARGRGHKDLRASFYSEDGRSYGAFDDLVTQVMASLSRIPPDRMRAALGAAGPALARAFPAVALALDIPPDAPADPDDDQLLAAGVAGLLKKSISRPAVVTLSEAEWADADSVRLLALLAPRLARAAGPAVLLVVSVRTDELAADHPLWPLVRGPQALGPALTPGALTRAEIEALVTSMLGEAVDTDRVAAHLHEVSEGNPLFIAEAIRALVESGAVVPTPAGAEGGSLPFTVAEPGAPLSLPASLKEVVDQRVARLTPAHQQQLRVASVLGRTFSPRLLQEVAGLSDEAVLDLLEVTLRRRLLVERPVPGGVRYAFHHRRVRELVYQRLGEEAQRGWHREAARALSRLPEEGGVELVAAHLFAARDYVEGAELLLSAAGEAQRRGDSGLASRLLERALECTAAAEPEVPWRLEATVRLKLGGARANLGMVDDALDHLRHAHRLTEGEDRRAERAAVEYQMARIYSHVGDAPRAARYYQRAADGHDGWSDPLGRLKAMNGLAGTLWQLGEQAEARARFEEVREASRRYGLTSTEATAVNGLGLLAVGREEFSTSITLFEDARARFQSLGLKAQALLCDLNIASSRRTLGDIGPARQLNIAAREALQRLGNQLLVATSWLAEAELALDLKDLDGAEAALAAFDALGDERSLTRVAALRLRAQLEEARGRMGEASALLTRALTVCREEDQGEATAEVLTCLGRARLELGSPVEAAELLRQAVAEAEARGSGCDRAAANVALARAVQAQGDLGQAARLLEDACAWLRPRDVRLVLLEAAVFSARLALHREERDAARALVEEAMDLIRFIREGLESRERRCFDTRPELREAAELWKRLGPRRP